MSASTIIFYILAALVVVFGALTVFSRKIFRAAISLLLSLTFIAGIYFLWNVDFIGALQIIIYVGGIVVLIIFSIFLTHSSGEKLPKALISRKLIAGILAIAGLGFTSWVVLQSVFVPALGVTPIEPTVHNIGLQMLSYTNYGYVFPFEVINILLLAALVGAIVIAIKKASPDKEGESSERRG
jgi:NADH-quinone oxidoreductase subunit J